MDWVGNDYVRWMLDILQINECIGERERRHEVFRCKK